MIEKRSSLQRNPNSSWSAQTRSKVLISGHLSQWAKGVCLPIWGGSPESQVDLTFVLHVLYTNFSVAIRNMEVHFSNVFGFYLRDPMLSL